MALLIRLSQSLSQEPLKIFYEIGVDDRCSIRLKTFIQSRNAPHSRSELAPENQSNPPLKEPPNTPPKPVPRTQSNLSLHMNIRTNSTISKRRAALRPVICTASIAAFMAAGGFSSGDTFTVNLGDNLTVGTAVVGPLVKNGLGTLNLTGAQAFAGGTTIDAGAIVITGLGDRKSVV